jgi:hypothetical protein
MRESTSNSTGTNLGGRSRLVCVDSTEKSAVFEMKRLRTSVIGPEASAINLRKREKV